MCYGRRVDSVVNVIHEPVHEDAKDVPKHNQLTNLGAIQKVKPKKGQRKSLSQYQPFMRCVFVSVLSPNIYEWYTITKNKYGRFFLKKISGVFIL